MVLEQIYILHGNKSLSLHSITKQKDMKLYFIFYNDTFQPVGHRSCVCVCVLLLLFPVGTVEILPPGGAGV